MKSTILTLILLITISAFSQEHYIPGEYLVRINYKYLDYDVIDDQSFQFSNFENFLNQEGVEYLKKFGGELSFDINQVESEKNIWTFKNN